MIQCSTGAGLPPSPGATEYSDLWTNSSVRERVSQLVGDLVELKTAEGTSVGIGQHRNARAETIWCTSLPGPLLVVVIEGTPRFPSVDTLRARFRLTKRETEVALHMAEGRTGKQIASALGISLRTAWRHSEQVLAKMNVCSRRDVRGKLLAEVAGGDRFPDMHISSDATRVVFTKSVHRVVPCQQEDAA